jgi:hypothetical protein
MLDNLRTGCRAPSSQGRRFYESDIADQHMIDRVFFESIATSPSRFTVPRWLPYPNQCVGRHSTTVRTSPRPVCFFADFRGSYDYCSGDPNSLRRHHGYDGCW